MLDILLSFFTILSRQLRLARAFSLGSFLSGCEEASLSGTPGWNPGNFILSLFCLPGCFFGSFYYASADRSLIERRPPLPEAAPLIISLFLPTAAFDLSSLYL